MKKDYIAPIIFVTKTDIEPLMAGSGVVGLMNDDLEIGYYGADEDGDFDPAANSFNSRLWDEYE